MARYDELGRELPDQTRPVGQMVPRPLTLQEEMRRFIRTEMSREAVDHGMETFEEADDFNVEDDEDLSDKLSAHEMTVMQEEAALPDASNLEDNDERGRQATSASAVRAGASALRKDRSANERDTEATGGEHDAADSDNSRQAEPPASQLRPARQPGDR